jgi:hypothetical protein
LVISNFTTVVSELLADFDGQSNPLIESLFSESTDGSGQQLPD